MTKGKYIRTPEIRAKIAEGVRQYSQQLAKDPAWRQLVSETTKAAMQDPEVRARHLEALEKNRLASLTNSSWTGGQGTEPNDLEKSYAWLLDIGYVSNFPVFVTKASQNAPPVWYRLDYALSNEKICFEIDGATHKHQQEKDNQKDVTLRALGWKVIRVRHW